MYDEEGIMERFKKAYNQGKSDGADVDESASLTMFVRKKNITMSTRRY